MRRFSIRTSNDGRRSRSLSAIADGYADVEADDDDDG
jgi:hypothetical protein